MTSITAEPRTIPGRRATYVPAARTIGTVSPTQLAVGAVAAGATALVACAATLSITFL
jgi:hypothetical protein